MIDYVIGEIFTIPSKGKVYGREINPHIKLRSMTTNDEMKRLSKSERSYQTICEIIDDCMVEKAGISSYDMCLGDMQYLMHKLRIVTYGTDYDLVSICPYCGAKNTGTINLEELQIFEYDESMNKYREFDLPQTKHHIKIRMQTPRMIDDAEEKARDLKKKAPDFPGDPAFLFMLESIIEEIDGKAPNKITLFQWIRELPMGDTNTISQYAKKLNDSIGIDNVLAFECDDCGLAYNSPFRITSEFFGPSLHI